MKLSKSVCLELTVGKDLHHENLANQNHRSHCGCGGPLRFIDDYYTVGARHHKANHRQGRPQPVPRPYRGRVPGTLPPPTSRRSRGEDEESPGVEGAPAGGSGEQPALPGHEEDLV